MMKRLLLLLLMLGAEGALAQGTMSSADVRRAADSSRQLRIVIDRKARRLWVIGPAGDTLRTAPIAVGSGKQLKVGSQTWRFNTPIGVRSVLSTEVDPVWMRPDWAYVELARQGKLRLDSISSRSPKALANGDSLVMRGAEIGVVSEGVFSPWPTDKDIVIGRVLYMPPAGTAYRGVHGALGPYRLNLGGAIGLHGTKDQASIGKAVTHGCIRLYDDDVIWLYLNVPVGTPVFIY